MLIQKDTFILEDYSTEIQLDFINFCFLNSTTITATRTQLELHTQQTVCIPTLFCVCFKTVCLKIKELCVWKDEEDAFTEIPMKKRTENQSDLCDMLFTTN